MSIIRILSALAFTLSLTGCASLAQVKASIAEAHARWDGEAATHIAHYTGAVSYRSDTLVDKPKTLEALTKACEQGRYVEVFAHVNENAIANKLRQTCVKVFVTSNRELLENAPMVLLDGGQVVVENGSKVYLSAQALNNELRYRDMLRSQARAYQGDFRIRPF